MHWKSENTPERVQLWLIHKKIIHYSRLKPTALAGNPVRCISCHLVTGLSNSDACMVLCAAGQSQGARGQGHAREAAEDVG